MKQINILTLFLVLLISPIYGQSKKDSLWNVWSNSSNTDKNRADALNKYAEIYNNSDIDSALFYVEKAIEFSTKHQLINELGYGNSVKAQAFFNRGEFELSEKYYLEAIKMAKEVNNNELEGIALYSIGASYFRRGQYKKALEFYSNSLSLLENTDNKEDQANIYGNIGIIHIIQENYIEAEENLIKSAEIYKELGGTDNSALINLGILKRRQGNFPEAIDLYMESLEIAERNKDERSMAYSLSNIGTIYYYMQDYDKFFEYMEKSLVIRKRQGDKSGISKSLTNIGAVYLELENFDKALECFNECLPIAREIGDRRSESQVLSSLGLIYSNKGDYETAISYLNEGHQLAEELGNVVGLASALKSFGYHYINVNNENKAIDYFEQAVVHARNTDISQTKDISFELYKLYESRGNRNKAFDAFKAYSIAKDSIDREENRTELSRREFKYAYDKKAYADSLSFSSERKIQQAKLEKTQNQRQSLTLILVIVLVFSIVLFSRNRTINKQKQTIQVQNSELHDLNENLEEKVTERTIELKKSGERYTYALEASTDGIWDYNVKTDAIKFSPAIYTMLGFEPYEFPETREAIYKLLHSEDVKIAKSKAHDLFLTENKEEFLADEYRLIGKDGTPVWIQVKGKVVERDDNNSAIRIVGTHTNITESKLRHQETLATILRTEDAERSRISKDIHDGLQQTLTISFLNFNGLKKHIKNLTDDFKEKYNLGWEYLQKSITESREVAHSLMPKSIIDFGVLSACQRLIDDMNTSNDDTEFSFYHNLKSERLPNHQIEITLYRILQESLNNIVKYAKATNVDIQLKDYDDMYMLTIEDNGIGFDTELLKKEGEGLGFVSMKNRLDAINGSLEIDSEIGEGTTVLVHIDKAEY